MSADAFHRTSAQVKIGSALDNAKERLILLPGMRWNASLNALEWSDPH